MKFTPGKDVDNLIASRVATCTVFWKIPFHVQKITTPQIFRILRISLVNIIILLLFSSYLAIPLFIQYRP